MAHVQWIKKKHMYKPYLFEQRSSMPIELMTSENENEIRYVYN